MKRLATNSRSAVGAILLLLVMAACSHPVSRPAGVRHCTPSPPTAEQVRVWAGFPEGFALLQDQAVREPRQHEWGELKWACDYGNRDHSLKSYEIALFEPGTLWTTNRDRLVHLIEEHATEPGSVSRDPAGSELLAAGPGRSKAYYGVLAFGPGGALSGVFSFHPGYDLLVMESEDAQDDTPPEKLMKNPIDPTNDLPVLFRKIEDFVDGQYQ